MTARFESDEGSARRERGGWLGCVWFVVEL